MMIINIVNKTDESIGTIYDSCRWYFYVVISIVVYQHNDDNNMDHIIVLIDSLPSLAPLTTIINIASKGDESIGTII
jgi:hypothetical protein